MSDSVRQNEQAEVKRFFRKIAKALNEFAADHNLRIEKYYHDIPGWEFLFSHPGGGRCYIEILKSDEKHIALMAAMWIHEHDSDFSYDKHTERIVCGIDVAELTKKLNEMLSDVLSWRQEDLERFRSKPSTMTREEFEKDSERYPIPKP